MQLYEMMAGFSRTMPDNSSLNGFSDPMRDMGDFSRMNPMQGQWLGQGFSRMTMQGYEHAMGVKLNITPREFDAWKSAVEEGDSDAIEGLGKWIKKRRKKRKAKKAVRRGRKAERKDVRARRREAKTARKEARVGQPSFIDKALETVAGIFDKGGEVPEQLMTEIQAFTGQSREDLFEEMEGSKGLFKPKPFTARWWKKLPTMQKVAIVGGPLLIIGLIGWKAGWFGKKKK